MPRTILVPDVPNWAWWRRCSAIQRYGSPLVSVTCEGELGHATFRSYSEHLICSAFTFSSPDPERSWALVANEGCKYEVEPNSPVYQHRMATRTKNVRTSRRILPLYKGVVTPNLSLVPFLREINPNVAYLRTGVDCGIFHEKSAPFQDRELVVGWCGKPSTKTAFSPKGYEEVLQPLIRSFDLEPRVQFVPVTNTSADKLSTDSMVKFYNSIDVFLVTSCSEGTPNCALEAMACGRPVIGTNVGILSEVNAVAQSEIGASCIKLVPSYRNAAEAATVVKCLHQEIAAMLKDRTWATVASDAARRTMDCHFNWKGLADDWLSVIRGNQPAPALPSDAAVARSPGD